MRAYDNGAFFNVSCTAQDVKEFNSKWPCSILHGAIAFTFDARNGDLVNIVPDRFDGAEVVALAADAQAYGQRRLKARAKRKNQEAAK